MTSPGGRFLKAAVVVTKVTAAGFGGLASWMAWRALHGAGVLPVVIGTCLGLLAWGTWRLRPQALGAAAGTLLFIAFMLVIGAVNPFAAMELRQEWTEREVALYIARNLGMGILAIFAAACVDHVRVRTMEQPPSPVAQKRITVLLVVLLAACLAFILVARLHAAQ